MVQAARTTLLRGGLNLVTPPLAVPEGQCTAALNYEPEVAGYRRISGYERFDGRTAPSDGGTRTDITTVPGTGPVRGVWVYNGDVYAFRDTASGEGGMYKSSAAGWVQQTFGSIIFFENGTAAYSEAEILAGATSGAVATIQRVVLQSGSYAGSDASGYLVVSDITGTFENETATTAGGSATINGATQIALPAGGRYEFVNHNFYGANKPIRMYFVNAIGNAHEWDGSVLAPIYSGNENGTLDEISYVLNRSGGNVLTRNGSTVIKRGEFDKPSHIAEFANHILLGFSVGSVIHSGVGEPLDYRAIAGAGEFSFPSALTGILPSASTACVFFGERWIRYLTGTSDSNFVVSPISDDAGAREWSMQMMGGQPIYLDEGGIRGLSTTSAFGDWNIGTFTEAVEPLFRRKTEAAVSPVATIDVPAKNQYWLFFDDNTGVIIYFGRRAPEVLPFLLPASVKCACTGVVTSGAGVRSFVGADDGYVYELNKGTSFDGAAVQSYIRLPWNNLGASQQDKRFHKAEFEIDAPEAVTIGVAFHIDYANGINPGGAQQDIAVAQGSQSLIEIADYDTIDWSQAVMGRLEVYLDGIGRNCALTIVSEHTDETPHTLQAMTMNYSPRRMIR